jgi:hypothetical protein
VGERWLGLLGLVTLMTSLYFVFPIDPDARGGLVLRTVAAGLLLAGLAMGVLVQLRRSVSDSQRRVNGLVGAIVAVLLVFALGFFTLSVHQPAEISGVGTRVDALYFSASTMMTIGYGDVHAVGQTARALVLVQMVFDAIFVAAAAGLLSARVRRVATERAQRES